MATASRVVPLNPWDEQLSHATAASCIFRNQISKARVGLHKCAAYKKKLALPLAGLFGEKSFAQSSVQEIWQNGSRGAAVVVLKWFWAGCKTGK